MYFSITKSLRQSVCYRQISDTFGKLERVSFFMHLSIHTGLSGASMLRAPLMKYDWSLHVQPFEKTWLSWVELQRKKVKGLQLNIKILLLEMGNVINMILTRHPHRILKLKISSTKHLTKTIFDSFEGNS